MKNSSKIVVAAPMSFSGSFRRTRNALKGAAFWPIGLPLLTVWWIAIAAWYVVFGLFLGPYRLIRRGSRKRKLAEARHQELLAATRAAER